MAVTPNSVVTPQGINTVSSVIATGDQTTPSLLCAAGANGDLVYKVLVYPAATDREVTLYLYDGANSRALCLSDIGADAAADVIPEDLLANVPLPLDSNGNKVLYLPAGYSLYVSAENVAVTNPIHVIRHAL